MPENTHMNRSTLNALITRSEAVTAAESSGKTIKDDAKWLAFAGDMVTSIGGTVGSYIALGKFVKDSIADHMDPGFSSTDVVTAFKDPTHDLYVAPKDRDGLPTQSRLSRAIDAHGIVTLPLLRDFRLVGNAPNLVDPLIPWVKIECDLPRGNTSKIDTNAMSKVEVKVKTKGGKLTGEVRSVTGPIKRPAKTPVKKETDTAVTPWGVIGAMSDEDLAKILAEPVGSFDGWSDEQVKALARQLVAMVVTAERAAAPADGAVVAIAPPS